MQAKKEPKLEKLSKQELNVIKKFLDEIGVKLYSIASNPMKLVVENAFYNDIFDIPIQLKELVLNLDSIYSSGFYLGYIKKEKFYPGLPLLRRISRLCYEINCIKLNEFGEKLFLYGKRVENDNIILFKEGFCLVLNQQNEPLGWGIGKVINVHKEIKIVEPVKDLGWYLRRGG
ncbi:protein involved in ribosomal biogenesis, contains PUA domain [Caldisphaera lagunensis DSM 15908]|uniref:Protein involved in ribosomal biogenesis, contains PUA domain n=1 Tax=Caldisphaera lagunensis (strain DSM 15908 / JCM 11604 / ANMR 0165 / IC-154) TaxID=1056495 RepID=L0ADQ0_CALLD|nr:ribosomal biogenesis protein [Caldisphaera lagunensis]AFZ71165.1 protein involved in ribosomal biogenesis, contains PUA domain [Caldisphaera lagunensis DSM 15908]